MIWQVANNYNKTQSGLEIVRFKTYYNNRSLTREKKDENN